MGKQKTVDATEVVWLSPGYPGALPTGEYRIHADDVEEGGRLEPVWGALVVWVGDNPDDPSDGGGHFEEFAGAVEDYHPIARTP